MSKLTLEKLKEAVDAAAALKRRTVLQPAGGPGDKVFPPTYEGGKYAKETRRLPGYEEPVECVLLDSVASQANRFEESLLRAVRDNAAPIPLLTVDFNGFNLPRSLRVTSLEAPHRIADALLRDSLLGGVSFRDSNIGKQLDFLALDNATALLEYCPTALLFGVWDSTGPRGGLGAKFARVLVSEIVGVEAVEGVRTSSRIDPALISRNAATLYAKKGGGWTLVDSSEAAEQKKGKSVLYGKDGRPSEANHGNVTPSIERGSFTIKEACQITVLSLAGLRKLRFPVDGNHDTSRDLVGRTALAALGLYAATLSAERGYDLRSRCFLFPVEALNWEILADPNGNNETFTLTGGEALALLKEALDELYACGLPWQKEEILLTPSPELGELVKRSQEHLANKVEAE